MNPNYIRDEERRRQNRQINNGGNQVAGALLTVGLALGGAYAAKKTWDYIFSEPAKQESAQAPSVRQQSGGHSAQIGGPFGLGGPAGSGSGARGPGNGWPGDKGPPLDSSERHPSCGNSRLAMQIHGASVESQQQAYSRLPIKQHLRAKLAGLITDELNFSADVYIIGSSVNGLCSGESDLDVCVMPKSDRLSLSWINAEEEMYSMLRHIREELEKSGMYCDFELRPANVPLLRFCTRRSPRIKVDMTYGSAGGIRSTHLIRNYTRLDDRVRQLIVALKLWAKRHSINDASKGGLSSYSLALMVIHYLQFACKPPVLPCLQKMRPDLFNNESKVEKLSLSEPKIAYSSANKQPVNELLIGFFEYFDQFEFAKKAIDVGRGEATPHDETGFVIVEPFSRVNISTTTKVNSNFERIRRSIGSACEKLKATKDLYSIGVPLDW